MKPSSARLTILVAIVLLGLAILVMRIGNFGGKQTDYRNASTRPRRDRLDTAALPHKTPSTIRGRAYVRRNIPVLGRAHTVLVDNVSGHLQIVSTQRVATDGSYEVKLADNVLAAFAGILIELPGHGFAFLDRDTCKEPDVDLQLVFSEIPAFKPSDGKLALLVDDIFPLDVTPLIEKWTPILQKRLGAMPGTTFLRMTPDNKGCYYHAGLSRGLNLRKISGRVTDIKGRPIATNIAIWMGKRSAGPGLLSVASATDGTFVANVDSEASVTVSVWDPHRRMVSEPKFVDNTTVTLVAKNAGLANVLVQEGGSGEPVQGLQIAFERQTDMSSGNHKAKSQSEDAIPQTTDLSGNARLLLPAGSYAIVVRDPTTKGGARWELPERRVSIKSGGPAARVQLRATRMRTRNLIPVQGVNPQ